MRDHISRTAKEQSSAFTALGYRKQETIDLELDEEANEEDVSVAVERYGAYEPERPTTIIPDAPDVAGFDEESSDEEDWDSSSSNSSGGDVSIVGDMDEDMNDLD